MLLPLIAFGVIPTGGDPAPPVDDVDLGLVTLSEARIHLRILGDDFDADIRLKGRAASMMVVDHVKAEPDTWTATTAPYALKAAALLVLGALFEDREGNSPVSEAVKAILRPYRTPTLQ